MDQSPGKSLRIDLAPGFREPLGKLMDDVAPVAKRLGLRVYLVGGTVRDLVAGAPFSGEWDLVVFGHDTGAQNLAEAVAGRWDWRKPVAFPRFGTYLVVTGNVKAEFSQAQLRTQQKGLDPHPLVSDALSRDFTVNTLYIEVNGKGSEPTGSIKVIDPTGQGYPDFRAGILRTPLAGSTTFADDPARVFRAARFKSAHGYRFHPSVGKGARSVEKAIKRIAPERIREELDKILMSRKPSAGLDALGRWRAFTQWAPEIQVMSGLRQDNPWHFPDLFLHTLRVVDRCPPDLILRWAALLHDCGKPLTKVPGSSADTFYGHDTVGAEIAKKVLTRLKCSRKRIKAVSDLVRLHMVHYQDEWSDRAVGRLIRKAGPHLERLLDLVEADTQALKRRKTKLGELERLRQRIAVINERMPGPVSPLDGKTIMDLLGIESGVLVGEAKTAVAEAVSDGIIAPDELAAKTFLVDWYDQLRNKRRQ